MTTEHRCSGPGPPGVSVVTLHYSAPVTTLQKETAAASGGGETGSVAVTREVDTTLCHPTTMDQGGGVTIRMKVRDEVSYKDHQDKD